MSIELREICPLNLPTETLSALRDETLAADEAERVQAHVPACSFCQARLEGFERVGRTLHAQRLPGPRASLWSDVQAAIAAAERRRLRPLLPRRLPHRAARPVWTGLGAMAATLTVTVLFGLVLRGMLAGHTGATIRVPRTATAEQTETQSATPTALATQSPYLSPVPGTP